MKNRNTEPPANVPPLFIADSKGNLAAWVEKCFPQNPTISPQEAIRLWLADGNTGRNTRPETSLRHTFPPQTQPQNGHRSRWDRDDERFATTLRAVAEMVTAALDNEHENVRQRNVGEDTPVRHPIHSAGTSLSRSPERLSEIDNPACNWSHPMEAYPAAVGATWSAPRTEEYSTNSARAGRNTETMTDEDTWTKGTAFLQNDPPSNGNSGPHSVVIEGKVNGENEVKPRSEEPEPSTSRSAANYRQSHSDAETTTVTSLGLRAKLLLTAATIVFLLLFLGSLFYRHRVNGQIPAPTASSPEALKNSVAERASPPVRAPLPAASVGSITPGVASVRDVQVVRERDGIAVEVLTDGEAVPKLTKLSGPDRVVLDFPQTQIATSSRPIPVNIASVKAVRMAMNGLTPPTTRVVVDLLEPCEYTMDKSSNQVTLHLRRLTE